MGKLLNRRPVILRNDGHNNMKSLAASALQKALQADLFKLLANLRSTLGQPRPRDRRIGIEIDDDPVRMFQIVVARTPRMYLEHPHLSQSCERFCTRERDVRLNLARLIRNVNGTNARRKHMIHMLLKETLLPTALR